METRRGHVSRYEHERYCLENGRMQVTNKPVGPWTRWKGVRETRVGVGVLEKKRSSGATKASWERRGVGR